jgi:dihydroneopterin aldolase
MPTPDTIEIRRLRLSSHIGVPDEERAEPQVLWITVSMVPGQGFAGLADDIAHTVDYHTVSLDLQALAAERPRRLIETLAVESADLLLSRYPIASVAITLEKRILPDTDCVAVHLERHRA